MEWFKFLLMLAVIFTLLATLQFYRLQKDFKKLKIGDKISKEFSEKSQKRVKIAISILAVGSILSIIGTFIRP